MRARDNKGVDLKELFRIRVPGLPGAALMALTISSQLWAEAPIIVIPPPLEAVTGWVTVSQVPASGRFYFVCQWRLDAIGFFAQKQRIVA